MTEQPEQPGFHFLLRGKRTPWPLDEAKQAFLDGRLDLGCEAWPGPGPAVWEFAIAAAAEAEAAAGRGSYGKRLGER